MKEIRYVDLGLKSGILWSDCYISKKYGFSEIAKLPEEQQRGYSRFFPTLENFKELYETCIIRTYQKGYYYFYFIVGPNGNNLKIMRGVVNKRLHYNYILYWLRDGFFEDKAKLPRAFLSTQLSTGIFEIKIEQYANLIFVKR